MTDAFVKDPAFRTVSGDAFDAMLGVDRHAARTTKFDDAIGRTHDHFWDPLDPAYIDFDAPFDLEAQAVLPAGMFPEMTSTTLAHLDEPKRIALANENARWLLSGILHGEQAALSLCAGLAPMLVDPGTQEFVANQAREEARHVTAFARYIQVRWGTPYPPGDTLGGLLRELVGTTQVYRKFVGMQILVEGLAVGVFTAVQMHTADPVLKRLTQLVITDESFHHRFGRTWADSTIAALDPAERHAVEDWAADVFNRLVVNLADVEQKRAVYARFGIDWRAVRDGERGDRAASWQQAGSVFRSLAKTLTNAGIITPRTRPRYAAWLDMDAVEAEDDLLDCIGDIVAQQGIETLRAINRRRRPIGRTAPTPPSSEQESPMTLSMRTHLETIADELAETISHPAYIRSIRDIRNAPREAQYAMAEALTVDWAAREGVPLSPRIRSVPRTFEKPGFAAANGVQRPGSEPGALGFGDAPADSYDHSSWASEGGDDVMEDLPPPQRVAAAVRSELGAIIDFVDSLPFQLMLAELRYTPYEERPAFVLDVVLNEAEREARGVFVPEGMLIQRSTFHDGRPTLFCVSTMTALAAPWRKLTFTFDNVMLAAA